jgi:hypothetical protein
LNTKTGFIFSEVNSEAEKARGPNPQQLTEKEYYGHLKVFIIRQHVKHSELLIGELTT